MFKKFTIQIIVILSIIALSVLIVVQFYWANNLIQLQQKQFNHKVKIALTDVGYQLRLIHHESIKTLNPVKQLNTNAFVVEIQDIVNPITIDSLLQIEFGKHQINLPYKIAIYDCFTDSVLFSQSGSAKKEVTAAINYGIDWDVNTYNFGVIFNSSELHKKNNQLWMVALGVVLLIMFILIYVVWIMIQQKQLNEVKNDFINNMTHELKTPIATISLSAQVINQESIIQQPDRLKKYAAIIQDENNRLKNQVDRVLQIAYYEKDQLILNKTEVLLEELLQQSLTPFKELIQDLNGMYQLAIDPIYLFVDAHHFTHIFSNLIDNAIKYRNPKLPLCIEISAKNTGDQLEIIFKDNGIGIPKAQQAHVFKKFYRVPTGNLHNVKGFGIGLSYVKLMVEMHQGKIEVESKINSYTKFILTGNFTKDK